MPAGYLSFVGSGTQAMLWYGGMSAKEQVVLLEEWRGRWAGSAFWRRHEPSGNPSAE